MSTLAAPVNHNSKNPSMTNRGQNRTKTLASFTIHDDNPIVVVLDPEYPNRRRANTEVLDRRGLVWSEEQRNWLLLAPRPSTTQPIRSTTIDPSQPSREAHGYVVRLDLGGQASSQVHQYHARSATSISSTIPPIPPIPRREEISRPPNSGQEGGGPTRPVNQYTGNWSPARDPAFTTEFARAMAADDDDDNGERTNDSEELTSSLAPEDANLGVELGAAVTAAADATAATAVPEAPKKRKRDIFRDVFQGFTSRLSRRSREDRDQGSGRRRASTMPSLGRGDQP